MILRLEVEGFKNLSSDDVYFGPLTAIAGPNGSGKSNLLDALQLLRNLASGPINAAFQSIRGGERNPKDVLHGDTLALSVDFLVPPRGKSPVGNTVQATATALNYQVRFVVSKLNGLTNVELIEERLEPLPTDQARQLLEAIGGPDWIKSVWIQPGEPRLFIGPGRDGTAICAFADAPSSQPPEERTVFETPRSMERTMLSFAYEPPNHHSGPAGIFINSAFQLGPKNVEAERQCSCGKGAGFIGPTPSIHDLLFEYS
jgi:energy-coupling factor transporter ATP-binding protein EcfA2